MPSDGVLFLENKMKIIILSDDFPPKSFGGAGIIAFWQAQELVKRGHEVTVITTVQEKSQEGINIKQGLILHALHTNYDPVFRAYVSIHNREVIGKIEKIIESVKPDIIHAHNIHQFISYKSLDIARKYTSRVFLTAHDAMTVNYSKIYPKVLLSDESEKIFDYSISTWYQIRHFWYGWNPLRNILIKHYLKKVRILAVSEALAEALRQNGITNVRVLHNGINLFDFSPSQEAIDEFKTKYNLYNKKGLFFGGRISRAKGGDMAIKLLKEVIKEIPETVLLIAGEENNYVKNLLENARREGISEKIILTGWLEREEVKVAYQVSDIVLTLSLYLDPFPTVNLEAMASKKPVVGTYLGGTPEIVIDGTTGYIVDPCDLTSVSDKVLTLLNDDAKKKSFGNAGYERVRNNFQLSSQVDKLEQLYQEYE